MRFVRPSLLVLVSAAFLVGSCVAVCSLSVHRLVGSDNLNALFTRSGLGDRLLGRLITHSRVHRLAALDPALPLALIVRVREEIAVVASRWFDEAEQWLFRKSGRFAPEAALQPLKHEITGLIERGLKKAALEPGRAAAYRKTIQRELALVPDRFEPLAALRLPAVVGHRIEGAAQFLRAFLSWHAVFLMLPLTAFSLGLALAADRGRYLRTLSVVGAVFFGCAAAVPLFFRAELLDLGGVLGTALGVRGAPARQVQAFLLGDWLDGLRDRLLFCYLLFLALPSVAAGRALWARFRTRGGRPASHA